MVFDIFAKLLLSSAEFWVVSPFLSPLFCSLWWTACPYDPKERRLKSISGLTPSNWAISDCLIVMALLSFESNWLIIDWLFPEGSNN